MAPNYSSRHDQLLQKILGELPKAASKKTREFVEAFYALSTVHDLEELSSAHAADIALTSEKFMATRGKAGPKISIQKIKLTENGRSVSRTQALVLHDDMPFLVDSLTGLFTALGLTIHRVQHPIMEMTRGGKTLKESIIYAELSPLPAELTASVLAEKIATAYAHVAASVEDWPQMRERALVLAEQFTSLGSATSKEEAQEIRDLLLWLAGNHFVFLGIADYRVKGETLALDAATARGIYRLPPVATTPTIERATTPTTQGALSVLKASEFSQVHRHAPLDLVVIKRVDAKGKFLGETRMLGLFTSTVYYRETQSIPFIRRKTARVIDLAGFEPSSHSGKALKTILEFMPRDELFQMDEDRLFQTAMGIVSLEARPQVRLFVRHDPFARFISAMVYIPRERFSSDLRVEIIRMVEAAYGSRTSTFNTQITDSPLARLHILTETGGSIPNVDVAALERQIAGRASNWSDALHDALVARFREEGEALAQSFANAFPPAYINAHDAGSAAHDVERVLDCIRRDGLALELFRAKNAPAGQLHLKCYTKDLNSELSSIIPLLEHMGCTVVDATPYVITPHTPMEPVLMRDFTLRVAGADALDLAQHKTRIEAAIDAIWRGIVDNDALNALVFTAGLTARDVNILRAYSRYLQQLNFPYSQQLIAAALNTHAALAKNLVAQFHARFDPAVKAREAKFSALVLELETALENVTNLGEDRIIRRMAALIAASLRTNFYQTENGAPKPYLSIKFRSNLIPEMPLPVPYAEIFVTSQRVEGIHLRGGAVARGGLRWSDRPEDFRTEVLGLVKAQMVKNAVIVPTGAKGGFILRKAPSERDALQAEGIACYKTFLRGLLDVTDNIVGGKLTPPKDVVRHDGDDPYLVVAADKGTATFSDTANGISAEYGFWLGDAFASGGSAGYDHKAMAITARGGWVAVERHFREMGKDITREAFTCVGIGDMSGDVFGNGALLAKTMRLIAAFNHRHIFIDPTPDAKSSYAERARLFALPRSGWNDYNAKLISKGGGVFERSAKSITLTNEMRECLGTDAKTATPDELIRMILKAPVELLWNGGIGTYVKAASETHEQVGDRANNGLRVDGADLRAKIIGEGGNLGFTQRGRIEYARKGGRINTDAIDNSAGVDCSDHEVNIKIALGAAMAAKRTTLKARDALLKTMTDEVAELVLRDNRLQTQAISVAQMQGVSLLEPASQLMSTLESDGFLNRAVEFLPDAKQLAELRSTKQGLTRPEISVLLAYAKMSFFKDLAESTLLDNAYFEADLLRYFPVAMQKPFAGEIKNHRLRREIVATMITNSIVNRTGFTMAHSLMRATGLPAGDIAQAYIATRDIFALRALWKEIEDLQNVSAAVQSHLFVMANRFIEHSCHWFLQHVPQPMNIDQVMARYAPAVAEINTQVGSMLSDSARKAVTAVVEKLTDQGVPKALADKMAMLEVMTTALDIADISRLTKLPIVTVGRTYFEIGAVLKLGWLRGSAQDLTAENYWQQLAIKSLAVEFYQAQRRLSLEVIGKFGKTKDAGESWRQANAESIARYDTFIADLRTQPTLDYAMLIVALRQVQAIAGA